MPEIFLLNPYFVDFILPFVLVFTLVFAILQKTKLLGDDKKQIDAMIGLVVGLLVIAFPYPRSIIVLLMPFLAVVVVILLVFMLLYGFVVGKKEGDVLGNKWKVVLGAILAVGLVSYLIYIAGYWNYVQDFFFSGSYGQIWINVILIMVIIGAIVAVIRGDKS
ncbi:MAG: hypothetical protein AABW90_03395 [Nanoarchaeota archaeon]